ncbi:MAG TPA: type III pantothenate kinase [Pirellulales bacterium]|nr:type III pantothenate kinase [Pirellulales bacterium]HWB14015.1 type III pantothenate kinase [Pirellulales bacterium]
MTDNRPVTIAAVDIGNSRIKVGLYGSHDVEKAPAEKLPQPQRSLDLVPDVDLGPNVDRFQRLADWLSPHRPSDLSWWIGSVQRTYASQLVDWLRSNDTKQIAMLASGDLPLAVSLPRPDMVGIDRLLAGLAANRVRPHDRPALLVGLGTAITVDLVSAQGAFLGGAILPGIAMAARSLHEFTDLLPLIDMSTLAEPPRALGTDTVGAMQSGIYWGAVGGIRHLIELMSAGTGAAPQVYMTGGAAPSVAGLVAPDAIYIPRLTLAGTALAAAANGAFQLKQ